jgi:hypothetical protein
VAALAQLVLVQGVADKILFLTLQLLAHLQDALLQQVEAAALVVLLVQQKLEIQVVAAAAVSNLAPLTHLVVLG